MNCFFEVKKKGGVMLDLWDTILMLIASLFCVMIIVLVLQLILTYDQCTVMFGQWAIAFGKPVGRSWKKHKTHKQTYGHECTAVWVWQQLSHIHCAFKERSAPYLWLVLVFKLAFIAALTSTYLNGTPLVSSACAAFLQKGHQLAEKNATLFPLTIVSAKTTHG